MTEELVHYRVRSPGIRLQPADACGLGSKRQQRRRKHESCLKQMGVRM
jgi:hypothetical protein